MANVVKARVNRMHRKQYVRQAGGGYNKISARINRRSKVKVKKA